MSSLREACDEEDWLSTMRLLMMNPMSSEKILIILEGITDIRFFNTYRLDNRLLFDSPENGKREVIDSVSILRRDGISSVYGICDADFDLISGVTYPGVFCTDEHDLEMMLVKGGVVDKFILMHTHKKFIRGELAEAFCDSVKGSVISACYTIGLLKLYNYLNESGLNFKGMKHRDFVHIDGVNISVNIDGYIENILSRSKDKPGRPNADGLKDEISKLRDYGYSHYMVCNGHDFMSLIKIIYDTDFSVNKNMRMDEIDTYMRLSYDEDKFQQTRLHRSLIELLA